MSTTLHCMQTTVTNISGERKTFSFLPPHGATLDPNETFTFDGTPESAMGTRRRLQAFISALNSGLLDVVRTPCPVLYDESNEESKSLKLDGGTLFAADPCWTEGGVESESLN